MARIVKPQKTYQAARLRCDRRDGELVVVGTGRRAYLWVGKDDDGNSITTYSGRVALRKLALRILECVGT